MFPISNCFPGVEKEIEAHEKGSKSSCRNSFCKLSTATKKILLKHPSGWVYFSSQLEILGYLLDGVIGVLSSRSRLEGRGGHLSPLVPSAWHTAVGTQLALLLAG